MLQLGILTTSYSYPTLEGTLDAIVRDGLHCMQFEPITAGIGRSVEQIDGAISARIRQALADRHLRMAALSGTVNMIHPDPLVRAAGMRRLRALIASAAACGTSVITLCTGSRDPHSMWHRHPANDEPEA